MSRIGKLGILGSAVLAMGMGVGNCQNQPTEVIVDNRDAGCTIEAGNWDTAATTDGNGCYGPDFLYSLADRVNFGRVRFTPDVPATGTYTVAIYWSAAANRTTDQPVIVHAANGDTTYHVNLQLYGHQWYTLGQHTFNAGAAGYIEFSTDTDAGYCNADAVRLTEN
jgi:hypothetical protein